MSIKSVEQRTARLGKPASGRGIMLLILLSAVFTIARASGQDALVSTMELMHAVTAIDGIRIVPAADMPGTIYTEDYAPSQVLEIIRPDMGPITVGRLSTSCTCLSARMTKKTFAHGERAFIEVRNVRPSQPQGATYAVFAQLSSPHRTALQYDLFIQSTRKPGDPVPTVVTSVPATVPTSPAIVVAQPSGIHILPQAESKPRRFSYEDIAPYAPKPTGDDDEPEKIGENAESGETAGEAAAE